MSCRLETAMWSRDTGQQIPCFDRCQLIITWTSSVKEVHCKPRALTIWMEFSVIPGRFQMERFIPVESFRKKGHTFRGISFSYSARLFTVILLRKNAKDLKDGGRFPKHLSLLCVSLLVGSVGGRFRTQLQSCRWKLNHVLWSVLVFFFPPELHHGKKCGCWLLVSLMKCGRCSSLKEEIIAFSKKKKTISKSSDKTPSTTRAKRLRMRKVSIFKLPVANANITTRMPVFELKSNFISIQKFKAGNVKPLGMHWSKDF